MRQCLECNAVFYSNDETEGFCTSDCEMEYREAWDKALKKGFPDLLAVNHIDGDPNNNDLKNLRFVSPRENRSKK